MPTAAETRHLSTKRCMNCSSLSSMAIRTLWWKGVFDQVGLDGSSRNEGKSMMKDSWVRRSLPSVVGRKEGGYHFAPGEAGSGVRAKESLQA